MKEIYKDIPNYEGLYQVSNLGNVKSLGNDRLKKEKILKNRLSSSGYLHVCLSKNKERKNFKVHQLVAIAFLNHVPDGHKIIVDHIDNNKLNNKLDNLQLISQRENTYKRNINTTSKYPGVHWSKQKGKWQTEITINGKKNYLGCFKEEIEAHKQYQKALEYVINNNLKEGDITTKELRKKLK